MNAWYDRLRTAWRRLSGDETPGSVLLAPYEQPGPEVGPRALESALRQVEFVRSLGRPLEGATLLEIGTGSQPVLPLIYFLAGVDDVLIVDQERVIDRDLLAGTAANLRGYAGELAERLELSERDVVQRLRLPADCTVFGALRHFKIQYLAPCNLLDTHVDPGSIDLAAGRDLLNVYQPGYVRRLLPRIGELLRPGGTLALCLARSDRLAYVQRLRDAGYDIALDDTDPVLRLVGDEPPTEDPRTLDTCIISTWKGLGREAGHA